MVLTSKQPFINPYLTRSRLSPMPVFNHIHISATKDYHGENMLHAYSVEVGMDWMGYAMLKRFQNLDPFVLKSYMHSSTQSYKMSQI